MTRNRLRQLRLEKDLTQQELAYKVGCTARAISFYETGARSIPYKTLSALAKFFDVEMEYVLGEISTRHNDEKQVPSHKVVSLQDIGFKQILKATLEEIAAENESEEGLSELVSMIKMLDGSDRETIRLMMESMLRNTKYKKQYSSEKVG